MSLTILIILLGELVVVGAVVVAAGVDVSRRIIPNETVLAVMVGGLAIRLVSPHEPSALWSLAAALVVLVLLGQLAHGGFMGGGDVKMISALTLAEPLRDVLPLLLHIALAGGVVATFYLLLGLIRSRHAAVPAQSARAARAAVVFEGSVPYGVSILLGLVSLHVGKVIQCSDANYCWL